MGSKRRIIDLGIGGLLLLLPALILHSSFKAPQHLSRFDEAVLRLTSPLQSVVSWSIEGIGGALHRYVWLVDVDEENGELRAENDALRLELLRSRRQEHQLAELEILAGLRGQTRAETVGARVISSSINRNFRVARLRIDRGTIGDGASAIPVAAGMPVINADGLVGRIHRVYGDFSDVLLVSDTQSSIDVIVARTGGRGVLTGLASEDSYRCKIEYLEQESQVRVGDAIVTSGLGSQFPAGLPVGQIVAISGLKHGLYQEVEVRPAVDFGKIGSLLILLAPPLAADPQPDTMAASGRAEGVRPL